MFRSTVTCIRVLHSKHFEVYNNNAFYTRFSPRAHKYTVIVSCFRRTRIKRNYQEKNLHTRTNTVRNHHNFRYIYIHILGYACIVSEQWVSTGTYVPVYTVILNNKWKLEWHTGAVRDKEIPKKKDILFFMKYEQWRYSWRQWRWIFQIRLEPNKNTTAPSRHFNLV